METKKVLILGSVILNIVFVIGLLTAIFTPIWDLVMFEKALPSLCPIIKEQRASEYTGFIKTECEGK